jgi:F-type H+-transporting ATPase subunit b
VLIAYAQEAAANAAPAGEPAAFPPFDPTLFASQLFWFALCFVALYVIMSRIALPKVGQVIEAREGALKADRDGAANSTAEAEDARASMEKALAKARSDARTTVEEMRAKVQAQLNAEQAQAEARIAKQIDEAEAKIAAARDRSLAEVGAVAQGLATEIVDKLAPSTPVAGEAV